MAFVHLFNKLLALSIYHAGLRVRGFRLTHAERVALKELDPATSDGVTKEKGSEVYAILHAQGWCADGALEDNNGNTVAMPTQTKCEELCNADPGCHYIAYGWVEQAGGYYRCASFGTCSSPTDYVQGSPSVFAKPLGRYTMLPTFSWCQDGPLTDNDGNAASIPTLSHCEAVCNSDPQCSFIAYGWATHHRGFFRCTTFSACSSPTVYLEGAVHVYEKPASRYEVRKTDSWCMDGTLSDNNGRAASFPTQVSCEASCDLDPRCNFIVFGWATHHGGFFRCATFQACDHPTKYLEGDPNVYAKPQDVQEVVSETAVHRKQLSQEPEVSKAESSNEKDAPLEHEDIPTTVPSGSGSFTSEGPGWKRWCSFKDEEALDCTSGTVLCIKTAFYSRTSDKGCMLGPRPPEEWPKLKTRNTATICRPNVVEKVRASCHGQAGCTLPRAFHDTCSHNPFTYIRVTFKCKSSCEP